MTALSPCCVTTYVERACPACPKSFDTNDLRRFATANTVPNKNIFRGAHPSNATDDLRCHTPHLENKILSNYFVRGYQTTYDDNQRGVTYITH